jgi:hypothetical protein
VFIAWVEIEIDAEVCAGSKLDPAPTKGSKSKFWSLQIGNYADRPPGRVLYGSDRLEPISVFLMRAMTEVQPEDIDPGFEQSANPLRRGARGTKGRDDLGATSTPHDYFLVETGQIRAAC